MFLRKTIKEKSTNINNKKSNKLLKCSKKYRQNRKLPFEKK